MDLTGHKNLGLLVHGKFDSGELNLFSGQGTVTFGGRDYIGVGQLMSVSEVGSGTGGEKQGISITLSGIDPAIIYISEIEEFQRRKVDIRLACFDDEGQIIEADILFSGLADLIRSDDSPKKPEITLHCEQKALDLSRPRPFKYLPQDQKNRHPGDTFFDLVQDIQNRDDTWGH